MEEDVEGVIVQVTANKRKHSSIEAEETCFSCSGILLNRESGIVLTTASVLLPCMGMGMGESDSDTTACFHTLLTFHVTTCGHSQSHSHSHSHTRSKCKSNLNDTSSGQNIEKSEMLLTKRRAGVLWVCRYGRLTELLLKLSPEQDRFFARSKFHEAGHGGTSGTGSANIHEWLSTFILLRIINPSETSGVKFNHDVELFKLCDLLGAVVSDETFVGVMDGEGYVGTVRDVLSQCATVGKGDDVWMEGSLFGAENPQLFMNSVSRGIVVSSVGSCNELIITDARCAPGCEGALLYANNGAGRSPLGIVIGPIYWKNNELLGLTLVCGLSPLLENLLWKCQRVKVDGKDLLPTSTNLVTFAAPGGSKTSSWRSVVLVQSGSSWGSGIVVDSREGLVITCSHVVRDEPRVIVKILHPKSQKITADVLYQTPKDEPLDVAVLKVPKSALLEQPCISTTQPLEGTDVIAVGFAIFPEHNNLDVLVTSGVISKVATILNKAYLMQTTCAVYGGASGGPIVSVKSGAVIGMITCNIRELSSDVLYPRINLAIPMGIVYPVIQQYVKTKDVAALAQLHLQEQTPNKLWHLQRLQVLQMSKL